ncbi:MAG: nucleotidyltransferase domain-containing protein [Candidatus Aenigmatarchaeota archaeon]
MKLREKYLKIANDATSKLKEDSNLIAVLAYGSLATDRLREGSDIDLLIIVKKIPENLDIFNIRHEKISGIIIDFNYNTEKGLVSEINFEVGCWLASGLVMNALALYDPGKILEKLKNYIISVPKQKKKEAFKTYIEESQLYADKLKNTPPSNLEKNMFLMREWNSMSHALFILNDTRPSSEDNLFNEILELKKKPRNFERLFKMVYGIETNEQKTNQMRKSFLELYNDLKGLKFS